MTTSKNFSIRRKQEGGRDYDITEKTVIDKDGYKWHFEGDEMKTFYDVADHKIMASNATVRLGTSTTAGKPDLLADVDDDTKER